MSSTTPPQLFYQKNQTLIFSIIFTLACSSFAATYKWGENAGAITELQVKVDLIDKNFKEHVAATNKDDWRLDVLEKWQNDTNGQIRDLTNSVNKLSASVDVMSSKIDYLYQGELRRAGNAQGSVNHPDDKSQQ